MMRSTPKIDRDKQSLWQAANQAHLHGEFAALQKLIQSEDKLAWHFALDSAKTSFMLFCSAVLKTLNAGKQYKISVVLALFEKVLTGINFDDVKMDKAYSDLLSSLISKLSADSNPKYTSVLLLLRNKIADKGISFDNSVTEPKHKKFDSLTVAPLSKKSVPAVIKGNVVEALLSKLPQLDSCVFKLDDRNTFQRLVNGIVHWDAHCIRTYTYHSPDQKLEDRYNSLESWLILSLLRARLDSQKFQTIILNMLNLRDELYSLKKYNSAFIISTILESSVLTPMIDKEQIGIHKFSDFQSKLDDDKINIFRPRELVNRLSSIVKKHSVTVPLNSLNALLSLVSEVETSTEEYDQFIMNVKAKLKADTSVMDGSLIAKEIGKMPRFSIEDLDTQIEITTTPEGRKRNWKTGPEYVDFIPPKPVTPAPVVKQPVAIKPVADMVSTPAPAPVSSSAPQLFHKRFESVYSSWSESESDSDEKSIYEPFELSQIEKEVAEKETAMKKASEWKANGVVVMREEQKSVSSTSFITSSVISLSAPSISVSSKSDDVKLKDQAARDDIRKAQFAARRAKFEKNDESTPAPTPTTAAKPAWKGATKPVASKALAKAIVMSSAFRRPKPTWKTAAPGLDKKDRDVVMGSAPRPSGNKD